MENKHKVTEKQLAFLEAFIKKKYWNIGDDTRIELIDHLVSDFEENGNGNMSQYVSNELEFIRKFIGSRVKAIKDTYTKQTWQKYFSFFSDFKTLPITIFTYCFIYFLSNTLTNKALWISFFLSVFGLYGFSLIITTVRNKKIRKLNEFQFLGANFGIPYILVFIPLVFEDRYFILENSIFFSAYWFFAFSYSIAAIMVTIQSRKHILEKYKHLLN